VKIHALAKEVIASVETSTRASDSCWQDVGDQSGKERRTERWHNFGKSSEREENMGGRSPGVIGM
jgi:hypothetical protein